MSWNLQAQMDGLRAEGLWRELRPMDSGQGPVVSQAGRELLNFSSNDYLGLACSDLLKESLQEGVCRYGAGAGASRLVCGHLPPHAALERALAAFKHAEAALTFTSGFAVPLGVLPALLGSGDTIIMDKLSHASLVDGARLSGATLRIFPHNHLGKLERLLQGASGRVLVVTESVFSMDGDCAPLAEMVELKNRYGAWLLVDEAHAVGVLGPQGRGLAAALGVADKIDLQMGTLSKAFGLSGGYLAASRPVVEFLINRARSFIYTTAPPPAIAHAALAALAWIQSGAGDAARARLQQLVAQLHTVSSPSAAASGFSSAIVPVIMGAETAAVDASGQLREKGFWVPAIRYPTVPRGQARLRVTLSASHELAQVEALAGELAGLVTRH